MIEAPVVVYPEMVSKRADGIESIVPLNKNGKDPDTPMINQPKVTIIYPSLLESSFLTFRVNHQIIIPKLNEIIDEYSNALKSVELLCQLTGNIVAIKSPFNNNNVPRTCMIAL